MTTDRCAHAALAATCRECADPLTVADTHVRLVYPDDPERGLWIGPVLLVIVIAILIVAVLGLNSVRCAA